MADYSINDVNPLVVAADNHNIASGSSSVFDEIGTLATKMLPAATVSGLYGVLNTPIELANWLGADISPFNTTDTLRAIDDDLANYYVQHKEAADLGGLALTSVISGFGAVKAIKLAQAGKMGTGLAAAFNLVPDAKQKALTAAISQIGEDGTTIFSSIAANKLKALSLGFVDNFITSAVMETMAASLAAASPVFDGKELKDIVISLGEGALYGAALGGVLEGIHLNAQYKKGILTLEETKKPLETTAAPAPSNLPKGDNISLIVNSVMDIPEELATTNALKQTLDATRRRAKTTAIQLANDMSGGDAVIGNKLMDLVYKVRDESLASGMSPQEVKEKLGDLLHQAKRVRRLNEADAVDILDPKKYFYTTKSAVKIESGDTVEDLIQKLLPTEKPEGVISSWLMNKSVGDLKIGMSAPTLDSPHGFVGGGKKGWFLNETDAFESGADIFIDMKKQKVKVNPSSAQRMSTPGDTGEVILNLKTGQVVVQADRTIGDLADSSKDIYLTNNKKELIVNYKIVDEGGKEKLTSATFLQTKPLDYTKASTLEVSARYAWVEKNPELFKNLNTVDATDFPILEKIASSGAYEKSYQELKLFIDGEEVYLKSIAPTQSALETFIQQSKLTLAEELRVANPKITNYILAQKLNTTQDFLELATPSGFMKPAEDFLSPSHVVIKYETAPTEVDGMFLRGVMALNQRQGVQRRIQHTAFVASAGERAEFFPDVDAALVHKEASVTGSGVGFLTASSPNYGERLKQAFQASGKEAKNWKQAEYEATANAFTEVAGKFMQNPLAATELSTLTEALRKTGTHYKLNSRGQLVVGRLKDLEDDLDLLIQAGVTSTASKVKVLEREVEQITRELEAFGIKTKYTIQYPEVLEHFQRHVERNKYRVDKFNPLRNSLGLQKTFDPDVVYPPPIDTAKYNFHAFVREKGVAVDGTNQVGVLVGRTEEELQKLASKVDADKYEVLFKKADIEAYHKALGDYQYELSLNQNRVNSMLERKGILANFFPKTDPKAVMQEYLDWHYAQDARLVISSIEVKYADAFAALKEYGTQYTALGTSKFAGLGNLFAKKVENPFEDYIRLATDISKKSNYTLWMDANEFVESLGNKAYKAITSIFSKASKGEVSWEAANKIITSHGLVAPYKSVHDMVIFNPIADKAVVSEFVNKANTVLANATLRLDFMNSINNIIATPINVGGELANLRKLVAGNSELAGTLKELTHVSVPGMQGVGVPSTSKLIAKAMQRYMGPEGKTLLQAYEDRGLVLSQLKLQHQVLDNLAVNGLEPTSKLVEMGNKAVEFGSKISGNIFAEQFTRFVSADIMKQLTDPLVVAGKLDIPIQWAYITTFVNRVQGNYIASQRPVLFQGVLGQAIGLFQTYQFNLLQNLFRYVEQGDKKAVAVLLGLQGTIYGLNGTPFFDAANKALIGNSSMNPYHKDFYSQTPEIVGKELGEWLLYGTASAMPFLPNDSPAIYSRGDINPRHWSIVPLSPGDVPAIAASIKVVKNLLDMGSKLSGGADKSSILLEGLEHNGISRPLSGLAQVIQGYATTSKGSLISAAQDFTGISEFARIAGAKPASEAIALDGVYRITAYKAKDRDRMERLGEIVKTKLRNGEAPTTEEFNSFITKYAASGGDVRNFNKAIVHWYKQANQSQINTLRNQMGSEYSKRLMEIMGGESGVPIQDFVSQTPQLPGASPSTE